MKIDYKPTYFKPYELVPKSVYNSWGVMSLRFFHKHTLITADRLREKYGVATVNDWHTSLGGGIYDSRGFRPPDDSDGAELSAHKRGMALDMVFDDYSAEEIREDIKRNTDIFTFEYITLIEDGVNWLHFSIENVEKLTVINI